MTCPAVLVLGHPQVWTLFGRECDKCWCDLPYGHFTSVLDVPETFDTCERALSFQVDDYGM
jgi:hypothetical protein